MWQISYKQGGIIMKKILVLFTVLMLMSGCNTVISDNSQNSDTTSNLSFSQSDLSGTYSVNGSTF